jgi:hypothetical protein
METIKIDLQNDKEKKVLLAFLDRLNYQYRIDSEEVILSDTEIQEMLSRKAEFLAGNGTARNWNLIKQRYEDN